MRAPLPLSSPISIDLTKTASQIAFVEGMLECLYKEGGLQVGSLIGFLEGLCEMSPMEKNAGFLQDTWDKIHGAAIGAGAGWQHPDVAKAFQQGDTNTLINKGMELAGGLPGVLHKGWDYLKQNVFTPQNLRTVAPYAISGLGTMLAAKTMGAGWGGAAAAGVAGGALGGLGYNYMKNNQPEDHYRMLGQISDMRHRMSQYAPLADTSAQHNMAESGAAAQHLQSSIKPAA